MEKPEAWSTSLHRHDIEHAISNKGSYDHRLYCSMNGDWWPIFIQVKDGILTIPEICLKDGVLALQSIEQCIYILARLITPSQIQDLLTANKNQIAETSYVNLIPENEDRGYVPFLIYKAGSDDTFHIIEPNEDGVFGTQIGRLLAIDPEATADILETYDYYFP